MRTFILKARKGTTRWELIQSNIGTNGHIEIIAHAVMNAFFVSNDFREDVELYIVLDSSEDFPRTIKLSAAEGLSIPGFHEQAILSIIELALKNSTTLQKDQTQNIAPGLQISGFGFEKLIQHLLETRSVYLLDRKGKDIREIQFDEDPVFILSDHLALPKNMSKMLKRRNVKTVSFGKKMLFASQCIVLLNHELDR